MVSAYFLSSGRTLVLPVVSAVLVEVVVLVFVFFLAFVCRILIAASLISVASASHYNRQVNFVSFIPRPVNKERSGY